MLRPITYHYMTHLSLHIITYVPRRGTKCAVAVLVWVCDASFGGKMTQWHSVYGQDTVHNLSLGSSEMHVIWCNACNVCVMHVIKILQALQEIT